MHTKIVIIASLLLLLMITFLVPAASAQQPTELEPYTGMKEQFEISLPAGWHVLDQLEAATGKRAKTGPTVIFSSEMIDGRAFTSNKQEELNKVIGQLAGVEVGRIPGFMLDRLSAKKGMSCAGFDAKGQKTLLDLLASEPMFGPGRTIREKPYAVPVAIGGCQGLRVKGKGTTSGGAGKNLDVFAVSNRDVLFLFKLLSTDEYYATVLVPFEKSLATLQLTGAPKPR